MKDFHLSVTFTKNMDEVIFFKKLTENAFAPSRATVSSAGLDLYSAYDQVIEPGGRCLCSTDIQIMLPAKNCYGRIAPRSGMALHDGIIVGAGVIDSDYRGNIGVLLFNLDTKPFIIHKGDRIAQLICERCLITEVEEIKGTVKQTERGEKGFGSSGR